MVRQRSSRAGSGVTWWNQILRYSMFWSCSGSGWSRGRSWFSHAHFDPPSLMIFSKVTAAAGRFVRVRRHGGRGRRHLDARTSSSAHQGLASPISICSFPEKHAPLLLKWWKVGSLKTYRLVWYINSIFWKNGRTIILNTSKCSVKRWH